jgi:hypothetical protein
MIRKIFENCVVSIENAKSRKVLWLEEHTDDNGKIIGYKVQKSIQPKSDVDHLNELKHLKPVSDKKH